MKKITSLCLLLLAAFALRAQNPFFEVVNYRGAFAPAPASMWTEGWTNWNPQATDYDLGRPVLTVTGDITQNRTWSKDTVYKLSGLVYVKNGAILSIRPGTVIRGDASVANSSLVITRGAKINAVGTSSEPIVFTSSKDTGLRAKGDWGGLIILGRGTLNIAGGVGNIEGIAVSGDTQYGGGTSPDDNDNSGNLKYVRIEYGGYVFDTDKEINGLTLGAVGRNTVVDYVQCSFINDDAFEWFGGTVNCSHLVAYRCLDDNFDTDNGYSGSVQFCLGVRDPDISDQSSGSTSEGFESDNDGSASTNTPQTTCVFSNVTDISAFRGTKISSLPGTFKFRRGARLRRNSGIKILNSLLMDAPTGVFIDGIPCRANMGSGVTRFRNNIIAGCNSPAESGTPSTLRDSLFSSSIFANDSLSTTAGLLVNPYDYFNPDYRPASGSPALTNVNFTDASFNNRKIIVSSLSYIKEVTYRGAFAPAPAVMWTEGWTNWNPQTTVYGSGKPVRNISGNIAFSNTWSKDTVYKISGLVYVLNGATLTIQPGTVILGDANVANSSLIITKGARLIAEGTFDQPIVFTSSRDTGSRAKGDWGGVILLGRAQLNTSTGTNNIEGIAATSLTEFGGGATPNNNDNSGILKYVRIEYGGYVFNTDQEINGLTLGAVGRGTTIDYVQCSFINDDAFEWFGGTVNCAHLVAYRCLDDNFDTDNGYDGCVQFCLGVRDPDISDQSSGSTSEGFESDNDLPGSSNTPQTRALFSNVTDISGFRGTVLSSWPSSFKFRRSARIRRNSGIRIFNSILMDAPYGVFIDGVSTRVNIQRGTAKFNNNLIAGSLRATEPGTAASLKDSLFNSGTGFFKNDSLTSTANVLINPYDFLNPDYRPGSQPLATTGFAFTDSVFNGLIRPCEEVNTPGPISGSRNINGCTTAVFSVPASASASSFTWTVSSGGTITSGQGTRTVTVSFVSTLTTTWTGTLSVVGNNDCGNTSAPVSVSLFKTILGVPGNITGPSAFSTNVCSLVGRTDTAITYSIPVVAGANSYSWTNPANTTIMSGQGTNVITLRFNSGFTTALAGDTLRVVVSSGCVTAAQKKLAIKAAIPALPAVTTAVLVSNVCGQRTVRYTANALPAGATGYEWSISGSVLGASANYIIDSPSTGFPNVRAIKLVFSSNAAAAADDSVKVRFTANCGNGPARAVKISLAALNPPAAPTITATNLVTNVCGARKVRYSVPSLPVASTTAGAATAYDWSVVGSGLGSAYVIDSPAAPADLTVTRAIVVMYTSNAAAASNDSVRCRYNSACGFGARRALKIALGAFGAPAAPASITITRATDTLCGQPRFRYTAPALPVGTATAAAATAYDWSFVPGSNLSGHAIIDSGTTTGRAIVVRYTINAPAASGDSIQVRYNTATCGFSAYRKARLTNTAISTNPPAAPASITISLVNNICGARQYRYTAPVLPAATATNSAPNGYSWDGPFGPVGTTGTIDSGNVNSRAILVTYTSNAAATIADSIRVRYTSVCGSGPYRRALLTNTALVCPGNVVGKPENQPVVEYNLYPNPNNGRFTLMVNNTGIKDKSVAVVRVLDFLGKPLARFSAMNENGKIIANINKTDLPSGIYVVEFSVGNITKTIKMVVVK